jgi:osmoprotectant transport system permease protein
VNFLQEALSYIFTAANWAGPAGLTARILEHLQYTAVAVVFSALIAVPIGMVIGHTGKGTFLVVTGVNALRALPTLGVLLLGVLLWGLGLVPPTVALMLLGIPPLLAGTYAGRAKIVKVDVDQNQATAMRYHVRSIPMLLLFKGGQVQATQIGAVGKAQLAQLIEKSL